MKTESSPSGLTRRSFIKRSVVAAVAASSMTIFSGLVEAGGAGTTGSGNAESDSCEKGNGTICNKILGSSVYDADGKEISRKCRKGGQTCTCVLSPPNDKVRQKWNCDTNLN